MLIKAKKKIMATSKKESVFRMSRTLGNIGRWCVLAFETYDSWSVRGWEVICSSEWGLVPCGGYSCAIGGICSSLGTPLLGLLKSSRPFTGGHSQPPGPPQCCVHCLDPLLSPLRMPLFHCHHALDSGPEFGGWPAAPCTSRCSPSARMPRCSSFPCL